MPKNAVFIERNVPFGAQIGGDVRALGDARVKVHYFGVIPGDAFHRLRGCVAQPGHHLKQRKIGVAGGARRRDTHFCFYGW